MNSVCERAETHLSVMGSAVHATLRLPVHPFATLAAAAGALEVKQRLRSGDVAHLNPQISSSVAVKRDAAQVLMSRAEHEESLEDVEGIKRCDVIALATHRRGGLQRWVMGSVTEHVLRDTKLPLLVVPPQRQRMPARSEQTEEGNMGIREQDTSAIFSSVR